MSTLRACPPDCRDVAADHRCILHLFVSYSVNRECRRTCPGLSELAEMVSERDTQVLTTRPLKRWRRLARRLSTAHCSVGKLTALPRES